jgi:hypothetical protein
MFVLTAQEWVDKFTQDMESGRLKPDDVIGMEYWTYDDVRDFVAGDDYYGEVTDVVAREVWLDVMGKLYVCDNVDNDLVRDTISGEFDKMIGGK